MAIIEFLIAAGVLGGMAYKDKKRLDAKAATYGSLYGKGSNKAREYYLTCLFYAKLKPDMDKEIGENPTPDEEKFYVDTTFSFHEAYGHPLNLIEYCVGKSREALVLERFIPTNRTDLPENIVVYRAWTNIQHYNTDFVDVKPNKEVVIAYGGIEKADINNIPKTLTNFEYPIATHAQRILSDAYIITPEDARKGISTREYIQKKYAEYLKQQNDIFQ